MICSGKALRAFSHMIWLDGASLVYVTPKAAAGHSFRLLGSHQPLTQKN